MTVHLLDVNVLVSLMWPRHKDHDRAQNWFARNAKTGWATCALTQSAVVRILSNPAFSPEAVSVEDAIQALGTNLQHPAHRFWAVDIGFIEAVRPFQKRVVGHRQVTDAYLLGLAMHRKGNFVTMDRAISALLPSSNGGNSPVVVI